MYDCQESPDYTVRKLDLTNRKSGSGDSREIIHIQYTSWPDRSALEDPRALLQLIDVTRVLANQYTSTSTSSPWLVHCSAGVGRTGAYTDANKDKICL